ncbi:3-methyl-2-oxobutanoate hydroxymethyltransferase [Methyloterricola oryzae]|uniref:3-methyl-2-oxobutanoate hydroxymethyltransferase n=1 Tax=Methyloterricola oryzae TaxID=1495050 RepID=UPI0009E4CA48|nr:3-methyl-2-oxobutanoate hydroxymethyltransferase [Methyloterricola oryzae]
MSSAQGKVTLPRLLRMKAAGEKIAVLTAYDAGFTAALDRAGVDVILVGDSLGMVVKGGGTTLTVTLDEMVYHSRCVASGASRAFIIADLPFMSYPTAEAAAQNAARLFREGGVNMVKLEGGRSRCEIVRFLVSQNMPVCGHLGLLPQSVHALGGYHMQAGDEASAQALLEDALGLQEAGASLLVLECIPARLAGEISRALRIPCIGIGAGVDCDGQVLVLHDMLGMGAGKRPRFVKDFLSGAGSIEGAAAAYVEAVRAGQFPGPEHSY